MSMTSPSLALQSSVGSAPTSQAAAAAVDRTKRKGFGVAFWILTGWLGVVTVCAIFGTHMPRGNVQPDYLTSSLINDGKWMKVFSWKHPLGVDPNGNDWLSAAIQGSRNSMINAFATVFFGFVMGGGLGMVAGYARGKVDTILSFITTVLLSFPPLLFIILLLTILSVGNDSSGIAQGLQSTVVKLSASLGILSIPILFRVVRASTMQFASREFVLAARAMGAKRGRDHLPPRPRRSADADAEEAQATLDHHDRPGRDETIGGHRLDHVRQDLAHQNATALGPHRPSCEHELTTGELHRAGPHDPEQDRYGEDAERG